MVPGALETGRAPPSSTSVTDIGPFPVPVSAEVGLQGVRVLLPTYQVPEICAKHGSRAHEMGLHDDCQVERGRPVAPAMM